MWSQPLDPLGSVVLSAMAAIVPLVVLLVMMGILRKSGALSAGSGLLTAALMALAIWHMPVRLAALSCAFGTVYALWPILWIVFTALWLYNLSVDTGKFELLRAWMARHATNDPNIQVIVVAFCFGALLEGTAGFGAPVAVASFLLVSLGFQPRQAVKSALIANTAPVAFGALGTPVVALAAVTGLDLTKLSAMVGRQLPFVSFLLPFYLVLILAGRKGLGRAWPAAAVSGGSFAVTQFAVSNFWSPYAVDIIAAIVSIVSTVWFLRLWKPISAVAIVESPYPIPTRLQIRRVCGMGTLGPARGGHGGLVVFQIIRRGAGCCQSSLPSQWRVHFALSQALRCNLSVSTSRCGKRRDGRDHSYGRSFQNGAKCLLTFRVENAASA